jgi:ribosomal protein S18 acetylase RimI-like enzyme
MSHCRFKTPHGEVLIRPIQREDWAVYRELRLEALKNHPTAFGADYEENQQHSDEHWQKRVEIDDEREALFFAEYRGEIIGMTGIYRDPGKRARHAATVWGVYVKPEWRGAHIAQALIEACLGWAREKEIVIARLGVEATNRSAIRCYERSGFRTYGIVAKAVRHEGQYFDACLMDYSFVEDG